MDGARRAVMGWYLPCYYKVSCTTQSADGRNGGDPMFGAEIIEVYQSFHVHDRIELAIDEA